MPLSQLPEDAAAVADDTTRLANQASAHLLQEQDFGQELSDLDLAMIIGGPLTAAIHGMEDACRNTLMFLKDVCFEEDFTPKMVEFELVRPGGIMNMTKTSQKIQIPFLTMVPVPHLRLAKVRVEFSVKLKSVRTTNLSSDATTTQINSTSGEKETKTKKTDYWKNYWWNDDPNKGDSNDTSTTSTSLVGVTSMKRTNKVGAEIRKEYSLQVIVTAVQDELPRGIEKMLDILENEVQTAPEDSGLQQQILQGAMGKVGGGGGTQGTATAQGTN